MIRIFGLLLSCGGVLFLAEHFLVTAQPFTNDVNIRTIHDDINNLITVVTECFVILFGVVLYASNNVERKVSETVIKHAHDITELEASSLVRDDGTGQFTLDDPAVEELALQYQMECPHRNPDDIISLKSLEISAITQLLPSEVRYLFEPLLMQKLKLIDETRHGN